MKRSIKTWMGSLALASVLVTADAHAQALVIDGETIVGGDIYAAAKKEGSLTVYSTLSSLPYEPIKAAFEKDTGVKINYIGLITPRLYQRAIAEHSAGKLEADYVDQTDLTLVGEFVDKGILTVAYKVPSFDQIPDVLKDPQGRWYSLMRQTTVIGVNSAIVKDADAPKSWKDLFDAKWKGKIGIANIDQGGSAFTNYSFYRQQIDPQYWSKLAAQSPRIYPAAAPMVADLVRGEVSLIIASTASLNEQIVNGAPVKAVFPVEGNPGFPTAGGITSSAKNPNAARLYLAWLTSKRGGDAVSRSGLYAANPKSSAPTAGGTYPESSKIWSLRIDDWIKIRDSYTSEWRTTFNVK